MISPLEFNRIRVQLFFQMQRTAKPPVSLLNEMLQQRLVRDVGYTSQQTGPVHLPRFFVTCRVIDAQEQMLTTTGEGNTKKEAAFQAALEMVSTLKVQSEDVSLVKTGEEQEG